MNPARIIFTRLPGPLVNAWLRITEPRVVAVVLFTQYTLFALAGTYAIFDPPTSIETELGANAMAMLAGLLIFGGTIGAIAALPGIWWLERSAVLSIGLSSALYLTTIAYLQATQPGNRMLQAAFVSSVLLNQVVRWVRIRDRSYRPEAPTPAQV